MNITIRRFTEKDIPLKVKWINTPEINRYLHYDLPLEEERTRKWFESASKLGNRCDFIIEADDVPCGLIGLLNIDKKNLKAELYLALGETKFMKKGISSAAVSLLLKYGFGELGLEKIYLYTETANIGAQRLFEKMRFRKEGVLESDLFYSGRWVDRCIYSAFRKDYVIEG